MSGGFRPRDIQGFYDLAPPGGNPFTGATLGVNLEASFSGAGAGYDLLDLATLGPTRWIPKVPGLYVYNVNFGFDNHPPGAFGAGAGYVETVLSTDSAEQSPASFQAASQSIRWWLDAAATGYRVSLMLVKYVTTVPQSTPICSVSRNVAATSIDIVGQLQVVQLAA